MAENLMNSNHKATNQQYRDNYDVTFADRAEKKEGEKEKEGETCCDWIGSMLDPLSVV